MENPVVQKVPNGYAEINAMFGNPANADGTRNNAWVASNIVTAKPPAGWQLYYQQTTTTIVHTSGIQVHKLLAVSFQNVLTEIWAYAKKQIGGTPTDDAVRAWLHNLRLDITGGGFEFRPNTSDPSKLSLHSYGIAIDWDPIHNPRQNPLTRTLPDWWYAIWAANGWSDGRHFKTPDPMHVQYATGA